MAREVESTHAFLESLAYRIVAVERAGGDWLQTILKLGAEAALAKVQATKCFEHCAREAAHLHGGNSYVKGNRIESLYRYGVVDTIPPASSLLERTFCLIYHTALLTNHKMTLMGCHFTIPPVYRCGDAMQPISVSSLGGVDSKQGIDPIMLTTVPNSDDVIGTCSRSPSLGAPKMSCLMLLPGSPCKANFEDHPIDGGLAQPRLRP